MARPHIYCLGPLVLDRVLEVDRLPGNDDKVFIKAKREAPGGPARNIAAAFAAWGDPVSLVSVVGDDATGLGLLASLDDEGIGSEAIEIAPDVATATTVIVVDRTGERAILIEKIAEAQLAAIGRELVPRAGDAVVATLFAPSAGRALARARAAGALAVLDLEFPEIDRWGWDEAFAAAAAADMVTTNAQVMRAFAERNAGRAGADPAVTLARALAPAGGRVVVTLSADGVIGRDGADIFRVAAFPVTPRDTTGASDRFLAALVKTSLRGRPFAAALCHATAAAGLFLAGGPSDWRTVETTAARLVAEAVVGATP